MKVALFTDGGFHDKRITGGYCILDENNEVLYEGTQEGKLGTNNEAEYLGLIIGLEKCVEIGATEVHVFMDSQLVVNQMSGAWRVKARHLRPLYLQAKAFSDIFDEISFGWVKRTHALIMKVDGLIRRTYEEQ